MHNLNNKIKGITKARTGFTLIEMLIVILIIVILLSIAVPSVIAYREDSQYTADLGAAKTVYTALETAITSNTVAPGGSNIYFYNIDSNPGNDVVRTGDPIAPGNHRNTFLFDDASTFLDGDLFTGWYMFEYDIRTNSINWVSYHEGDVTDNGDRYAANSKVMVYDAVTGTSGYLDDLITQYSGVYTEDIHGHKN